ncbi:MAG TPA: GAF domain-containing protein [Planctomycetota bacterium]|nr:GAF domain-containing protein [Planctomycetota bacterium]
MSSRPLEETLCEILERDGATADALDRFVRSVAEDFAATTCTLHVLEDGLLRLRAQMGLPPQVAHVVATVPIGKGMAGICAERREPVTVCNLQSDDSGVVRPGARETKVHGGLVIPLLAGDRLVGTLGVGKPDDHDYSPDEVSRLARYGTLLVRALSS